MEYTTSPENIVSEKTKSVIVNKETLYEGIFARYINIFLNKFPLIFPIFAAVVIVGFFQPFGFFTSLSLISLVLLDIYYVILLTVFICNTKYKIVHAFILFNSVIIIPYVWYGNFSIFSIWSVPSAIAQVISFIILFVTNRSRIPLSVKVALIIIPLVIIFHALVFIGIGFYGMGEGLKSM